MIESYDINNVIIELEASSDYYSLVKIKKAFNSNMLKAIEKRITKSTKAEYLKHRSSGNIFISDELSRLDRSFQLEFSIPEEPFSSHKLLNQLKKIEGIESVEYSEIHTINPIEDTQVDNQFPYKFSDRKLSDPFIPNDIHYTFQNYLPQMNAEEGWGYYLEQKAEGKNEQDQDSVIIAVVDTGFDLAHEDILSYRFVNLGESGLDAEGRDKSNNGIDDDGNGYIDDSKGINLHPDSSPEAEFSLNTNQGHRHGVHVAGIIAAEINNGIGVAGIASIEKNIFILPVKIGSDDPGDNTLANSYEGVLYAIASDAHIINCSWGSPSPSSIGQDVATIALQAGALIVAAAGNNNRDQDFFPAAYDGVLSVTAVEFNNRKPAFANYSFSVDIAAPGLSILNTVRSNQYDRLSGTSMATPLVSGTIALMKSLYPETQLHTLAEALKSNADPFSDNIRTEHIGKLGMGVINLEKALRRDNRELLTINTIWQRQSKYDIQPSPAGIDDSLIAPKRYFNGDTVFIGFQTTALDEKIESAVFSIDAENESILSGPAFLSSLESGVPQYDYSQWISANGLDFDTTIDLLLKAYNSQDRLIAQKHLDVVYNPTYLNVSNKEISFTATSTGNFGFNNYPENSQGIGLKLGEKNILYESGIILTTSPGKTLDNIRASFPTSKSKNFRIEKPVQPDTLTNGTIRLIASYSDGLSAILSSDTPADTNDLGIWVDQITLFPENGKFLVTYFKLIASEVITKPIDSLFFGLFADWDISNSATDDAAYYDFESRGMVLLDAASLREFPLEDRLSEMVKLKKDRACMFLLSGQRLGCYAMDNDGTGDFNIGIYNGFSKEEKYKAVSKGLSRLASGITDASSIISAGPMLMMPGDTINLVLAMGITDSEQSPKELRTEIEEFVQEHSPIIYENQQSTGELGQLLIFPNPVRQSDSENGSISFNLNRSTLLTMQIFDMSGRLAAKPFRNKTFPIGRSTISIPSLAKGHYRIIVSEKDTPFTMEAGLVVE
ncbi:MAG: hypothetical protein Kapaf2KO_03260 [Candidatus Kapaibacteriales bacterium]